jgi:nucleotide-binding universal stress UspA family protein
MTVTTDRTIAIPVDASEHALKAVEWANDHLLRPTDKVVLVHCFHMPVQPSPRMPDLVRKWEEEERGQLDQAKLLLKNLATKIHATAHIDIVTVEGDPMDMIDGILQDLKPDTIVCGSRGLNQLKRLMLGSLSNHLLHSSSVPVVIVH